MNTPEPHKYVPFPNPIYPTPQDKGNVYPNLPWII